MTNDQVDMSSTNLPKSKNINSVELHGCIVCARIYSLLAVYTPDGILVNCAVTSPGGHRVLNERRPLVACDTHSASEIEAAVQRWQSRIGNEPEDERGDDWDS